MRYQGKTCLVASMHEKERAIRTSFESLLGFQMEVSELNTDALGTFTGEIERSIPPKECAKTKCLNALLAHGKQIGIANEGSFVPHPVIPFISVDYEIFFFTDLEIGYELCISKMFTETNFAAAAFSEFDSILELATKTQFPSHALIVRPNRWEDKKICFKGIQSIDHLYDAFEKSRLVSSDKQVWVETDMRAHKNPTRMAQLEKLAKEMAQRLATPCPVCSIPGWGPVDRMRGLSCADCGAETNLIKAVIWGCCQCPYKESIPVDQALAEPQYCPLCNP
ncbi:MAG: hypothetical protein K2Y01_08135 [Rhabdochlamydiaceae bacterium]|nr:hypothetical protein [Rhabdochlamydiaceae bacterium]